MSSLCKPLKPFLLQGHLNWIYMHRQTKEARRDYYILFHRLFSICLYNFFRQRKQISHHSQRKKQKKIVTLYLYISINFETKQLSGISENLRARCNQHLWPVLWTCGANLESASSGGLEGPQVLGCMYSTRIEILSNCRVLWGALIWSTKSEEG